MGQVIAISATPALVNSIENFVQSVEHGRSASANNFIELMDHVSDRLLSLFLVEPGEFLSLPGGQKRIIDFAISTAGKASHMLTRQIYKKKTPEELAPVAANVRAMYWPAGDDNGNQAFITYPADDAFAEDFRKVVGACVEGRGSEELQLMSKVMDRLTDDIIENFFLRNAHEVKIGYVTRKALDMGIDGTKKAVHAVIHKVLRGLDDEHLKLFMGHYQEILRQR